MKVLMINGSPRAKGNTYIAFHEYEFFDEEYTAWQGKVWTAGKRRASLDEFYQMKFL